MLRLRNGDGLTEPGAMSSLRFIPGIDMSTIGSCCFRGWDSWVLQPWWFFSCNDSVAGSPLAAWSKILGEKTLTSQDIFIPKKVADECSVNSGTTGVFHFAAPLLDVVIHILQQTQCKINPACKQLYVWELFSMSELNRRSYSCVRNWFRSL